LNLRQEADPTPWYRAALPEPPAQPPLRGAVACDVGIVGGGIAGVSAALALAERGRRVVLLEARSIGSGASGRNGGQILPGFAIEQGALQQLVGEPDAKRLWQLSVQAIDDLLALLARHGIDCDWRPGHVQAALKPRHVAALAAWQEQLATQLDYPYTALLDRDGIAAQVASPRYVGGLIDNRAGHLDPLKYLRGLATAAMSAGCVIHEDSRVLHYETLPGAVRVTTAAGELRCGQLLLAGNASLGDTAPALTRRIIGVGTGVVATAPLGAERAASLLPGDVAVSDTNWVLDYFRRSRDGRLLFGGGVRYASSGDAVSGADASAQALRQRMLRVFPQLEGVRIDHAWSGQLDLTLNRAPDFGRMEREVYYLQGFSGHGVLLAGLGGRLVAEAMAGSSEAFDVFARIPHRCFPGGPWLRRPALVLAMLWYRLRDLI
jgi:gamma-glutamylputrescine oxidase